MSASRKFCEALPILHAQAKGLEQTARSLSASKEFTAAQVSLMMLIGNTLIGNNDEVGLGPHCLFKNIQFDWRIICTDVISRG